MSKHVNENTDKNVRININGNVTEDVDKDAFSHKKEMRLQFNDMQSCITRYDLIFLTCSEVL
jgi:hypothetical protein